MHHVTIPPPVGTATLPDGRTITLGGPQGNLGSWTVQPASRESRAQRRFRRRLLAGKIRDN